MAHRLGEVIERYLKANHSNESTKCLKFTYDETYSSTDNSRKIDVYYKFGQAKEVSYYQGQSKFTAVVKEKKSDAREYLEFFMYLRLIPEMELILKDYNKVWKDTKQKFGANYIYSEENFLFLEYLQSQNYQRISNSSLSIGVAKTTLRKLAQFHASSLVYLKKGPADDVIPKVPLLLANDEMERRLYAAIKTIEGYWPEFKDITTKLRSCVETINKSITDLIDNKLSQFKIIALGEPSIKNMLMETGKCNNDNANVVFNNFKNCFVGYCGYDLNFFFFANLTLDVLTSNRYELLHYYHEHFAATLKSLNEPCIPSWQTILQEVREFEFIGIYALLCEMPIYNTEYNFRECYTLESENSNFAPISFEQQYEILFNNDRVKTLLKYGLDRFYELHLWDKK